MIIFDEKYRITNLSWSWMLSYHDENRDEVHCTFDRLTELFEFIYADYHRKPHGSVEVSVQVEDGS